MTPELAKPVSSLIDDVLDIVDQIGQRHHPDLIQEKQRLRMKLDALGSAGRPTEGPLIQRVLVYWTDEILTEATGEWQEMTFEFDYFREQNRAWRFYEYGERHARTNSSDVVEVWYLCLALGFKGAIDEAFRDHLHLPLPGSRDVAASERKPVSPREAWAAELARQIRQPQHADLAGEPLKGDVEPITGASWLQTALGCLFVVTTAFIVLLSIWLKLKQG